MQSAIERVVIAHQPVVVSLRPAEGRRALDEGLQRTGLAFGTPALVDRGDTERLSHRVVTQASALALQVMAAVAPLPAHPEGLLLALWWALCGEVDAAVALHKAGARGRAPTAKTWREVELLLERRAESLETDPSYGLMLHTGAVATEAMTLGRLAWRVAVDGQLDPVAIGRCLTFASQQRAALVRVLVTLVCVTGRPSLEMRRAVLGQLKGLHLDDSAALPTEAFVRRAFTRGVDVQRAVGAVRSLRLGRFLVQQVVLASLVDGRRSLDERVFTFELAQAFDLDEGGLRALERQMGAFYAEHRDAIDVFALAPGAEVLAEELVDSVAHAVKKSSRALMKELHETKELSVLLARAAQGQTLTADEKKAMRAQLIDVAKAIPALAVFTAPGGILLLVAMAKLLKFDVRPSSFRDEP